MTTPTKCLGCHPHPCECDAATRRAWAAFDKVAAAEREARQETPVRLRLWRRHTPVVWGACYQGPQLPEPEWDPATPALYDPPEGV